LIIYGQTERVARFVADNIPGCSRGFGPCQAVGFEKDGRLVAGVVYHNWNPETGVIEISAASTCRNWLNRDNLGEIFGYPFRIGCRLVVARIAEGNNRARRIWRSLGSDEYIIPALRSPHEAEVIYTLSADQWQASFGKRIYGQAQSANTARPARN